MDSDFISTLSIVVSTISIFLLLILKLVTVLELLENKVWWIWWWKNKNLFEEIKDENNKFKFWKSTNSDLFIIVEASIEEKEIKFPFSEKTTSNVFKIDKKYENKNIFNINKILIKKEKIYYFFIIDSKNKQKISLKLKNRTNSKFEIFKLLKKFDSIYIESSIKKLI